MAGYVCTVAAGKGGVGKTTTAINVAAALQDRGYDVVVVDADLGMANLAATLGVEGEESVHEVLAGEEPVSAALTDVPGGMTIVPGEQRLEAFAEADPANLPKVVETLRDAYDVIVVDTGAGLSHETTVPLGLADGVLLLTTPDDVAVADAVKTAELTERVGGEVLGAAVNRVTGETDLEPYAEAFDAELLAVIPEDAAAAETEPLVVEAPESPTADAYRQLADLFVGVFFEDEDAADAETIVESEWFGDEDDDEDDDGSFTHGVFQGI